MTNHPNRGRKSNLLFVGADGYAHLTLIDAECGEHSEIVTCRLHDGKSVKIDDGKEYPQLCSGGARMGSTLSYAGPEQLARDCDARLFKTREGYDRARNSALGTDSI